MHKKEIFKICRDNIKDEKLLNKITFCVLRDEWNQARLLSEGLVEDFPDNNMLKILDDLIKDNFYK